MMKRVTKYMTRVVALMVAFVMASCASMDPIGDMAPGAADRGEYATAFGVFDKESGRIISDEGVTMDIAYCGPQTSWYDLERSAEATGGRIFFNYTMRDYIPEENYAVIVLNRLYDLFVEEVGVIDETTEDGVVANILSLQPAMPYQASYSGGYINIRVYYSSEYSPSVRRPQMALDCDLLGSKLPSICFYLSHKADEDDNIDSEKALLRDAWFSFRVSDELQEVLAQAELFVFRWCWWLSDGDHSQGYNSEHYSTLVFGSGESSERALVVLK